MAKVIFADNILRAKGVTKRNFNTSELNDLIEGFFMTHNVKEKILLVPKRFIEMENPPEGDIINYLDTEIWKRRVHDPEDDFDFSKYMEMLKDGLVKPTLVINEPFIGNAAAYLRSICGFDVKTIRRRKRKIYVVTLPI